MKRHGTKAILLACLLAISGTAAAQDGAPQVTNERPMSFLDGSEDGAIQAIARVIDQRGL